jgi:catechol 2,3-dioxygenase-like lactoylglutathione lyase family enzyme
MQLTSVRIFVDDLEKAATFYEGIVGLSRSTTAPTAILYGDSPSLLIEAADDGARRKGLLGRFTGVGFRTDDARALYVDLKARGVPLHGPPEKQPWGGTLLFAEDPSGNTITFVEYPTEAAPGKGP